MGPVELDKENGGNVSFLNFVPEVGMAVPKNKTSKARSRRRRSINMAFKAPQLVECDNCGNMKLPHRVCPHCGYYIPDEAISSSSSQPTWIRIVAILLLLIFLSLLLFLGSSLLLG